MKSNKMESHRRGQDGVEFLEMEWNGLGWDEMRWDGT